MTAVIKITGNSQPITTSNNNIAKARLVYIWNSDVAGALITQFDPIANVQIGTIQVPAGQAISLEKNPTDVITSNNATLTLATPIAFKN